MKIEITLKPDYVSWEDITELLHLAFAEHYNNGLHYCACDQSVDVTRERAKGAICLVALGDGKLIGTGLISIKVKGKRKVGYFSQLGILPEAKGLGVGSSLFDRGFEICRNNHVEAVYSDTSEKAESVISFHLKNGFQKVKLLSHKTTNYYSIGFRHEITGRRYSAFEVFMRFFISSLYCHCLWNADGSLTLLGKILKSIKNYGRKNKSRASKKNAI